MPAMDLSLFGEKFTRKSGISELMDDLGIAMAGTEKFHMLGGGNPAHIPEINELWRKRMGELLLEPAEFDKMLVNYDTPQGKPSFLESLAQLFHRQYGWDIKPDNIGITNGSQSTFFLLFNILAGLRRDGSRKKILFPLMPEYIGYADQGGHEQDFTSCKPIIREFEGNYFKYYIDFNNLEITNDIAAVCVSRPTNPTGNVLTDKEIHKLSEITKAAGIPLIIDNAYGTPFPNIIFEDIEPTWDEHIILTMSLSKLGLPGTRTGIAIASPQIIQSLSSVNAILSLANGSVGQMLVQPLIQSGKILEISKGIIKPYYLEKSKQAQQWIHDSFDSNIPYRIHKSEGSLFLWLWFKNLPITTKELYTRLKKRKVLIIPGEYFFYGLENPDWEHSRQCIRITYSQHQDDVRKGIEIMADELRKIYS